MIKFRLQAWAWVFLLVGACPALLTGAAKLNTNWLVPTGNIKIDYKRLDKPELRICALTFDDGPDTVHTPAVAAILDRYKVKATFFVVGSRVDSNPKGLRALVVAGHEIGNHTQSHPYMNKLGADQQRRQILQLQDSLDKLDVSPVWFRPPYGAFNSTTVSAASKLGMETVLWSVDPRDWAEPGASVITQRVVKGTVPGAVILLHSTHGQTVQALPAIIESLQEKGYSFVTMSEWRAAVTQGKLPLPAASEPLSESGSGPEQTLAPAGEAGRQGSGLLPRAAVPDKASARQAASDQGAPRLLPPFTPREAGIAETAGVPGNSPENVQPATDEQDTGLHETPTSPSHEADQAPTAAGPATARIALELYSSANADGPEEAAAVWNSAEGRKWRSWQSSIQDEEGLAGFLSRLSPLVATAVAPVFPAALPAGPPLTSWSRQSVTVALDVPSLLAAERAQANMRYRPAASFYLLTLGSVSDEQLWGEIAAYHAAAGLNGLLLGTAAEVASTAPEPRATVDSAAIGTDAIIDPGLQGSLHAVVALQSGYSNIYLAIRPGNSATYSADKLGRGQRELLLLRRLTQGLQVDAAPESDLAQDWPLPSGVQMLRFFDAEHEVLAVFCPRGECEELSLPEAAKAYCIATLDSSNQLVLSPADLPSLQLGRNVLLLCRDQPAS